jgi:hypothetical protein
MNAADHQTCRAIRVVRDIECLVDRALEMSAQKLQAGTAPSTWGRFWLKDIEDQLTTCPTSEKLKH